MAISFQKMHPDFFAEIRGIDLRDPLDAETTRAIDEAMTEYAVVAIKNQNMSDADHLRFSRAFGPLELPPTRGRTHSGKRLGLEFYDASNLNIHGEILPADDPFRRFSRGNQLWHTDSSYKPGPTKWSLLHAVIIPPEGGNTDFVDMRAVYAALPDAMKKTIENLVAEHDIWHSRQRAGFGEVTEEQHKASPPVPQRLVQQAADGRRTLYIGAHASHIIGWPVDEGRALIDELCTFLAQPRFVYSHTWDRGDVVIWDNRCTNHRAGGFDSMKYKRDMRRTTIKEYGEEGEDTPVARTMASV